MQIVYRAQDITEAHIVAGLLESNDIVSHVGGHYLQGGIGEVGVNNLANVHVNDEDFERARQIVVEYEQAGSGQQQAAKSKPIHIPKSVYFVAAFILILVLFLLVDS